MSTSQKLGWTPACFKVEPGEWSIKWPPPDGFIVAAVRRVRKDDGRWITLYRFVASKITVNAMRRKLRARIKISEADTRKRLKRMFRG